MSEKCLKVVFIQTGITNIKRMLKSVV